jgi:hypothetical protein
MAPTKSLVHVKHKLVLGGVVVAVAVAAIGADGTAAPERGLFIPGRSLGGVEIGMTKAEVLKAWGKQHGVCRDCRHTTWYFNERPFEPQGTGVVFEEGRATNVFTVWQPKGWRTPDGLALGDPAAEIARTYGPLERRRCSSYYALVDERPRLQAVYYVFRNEAWGFGLTLPDASPCL